MACARAEYCTNVSAGIRTMRAGPTSMAGTSMCGPHRWLAPAQAKGQLGTRQALWFGSASVRVKSSTLKPGRAPDGKLHGHRAKPTPFRGYRLWRPRLHACAVHAPAGWGGSWDSVVELPAMVFAATPRAVESAPRTGSPSDARFAQRPGNRWETSPCGKRSWGAWSSN